MLCPGDYSLRKLVSFCFHGVCSLVEMAKAYTGVITICKKMQIDKTVLIAQ